MPRNTAGTYTAPAGNPVSSGSVIRSTWANTTVQDLGGELTNSLSRDGYGDMRAPLKVPDGSAAAPTYTFTGDPDSGLFLQSAGHVGVTITSTLVQLWTAALTTISSALTVAQGVTITTGGLTVTAGGATVTAGGLTVTAGGATVTAGGLTVTAGGATVSAGGLSVVGTVPTQGGVEGASKLTTTGAISTTSGQGHAITTVGHFIAGATNNPVRLNMRTENATTVGVWQDVRVGLSMDVDTTVGAGGSALFSQREGLRISAAVAATGASPTNAVELVNGNLKLSGTAPNSTVSVTNTLTSKNIIKAWARIATDGASGVSVGDGFGIASVAISSDVLTITWATAFASINYAVTVSSDASAAYPHVYGNTTTTISIELIRRDTGALYDLDANVVHFMVIAVGAQ